MNEPGNPISPDQAMKEAGAFFDRTRDLFILANRLRRRLSRPNARPVDPAVRKAFREAAGPSDTSPKSRAASLFEAVHKAWLSHPRTGRSNSPKHPLGPLVRAWLEQPRTVKLDTRDLAILPEKAVVVRDVRVMRPTTPTDHVKQDSLFPNLLPAPDQAPDVLMEIQRGTPGWLPGCEPPPSQLIPSPIIAFWEQAGGLTRFPGRFGPAPLDQRMFNEVLMSAPAGEYGNILLETTVRQLALGLWPPKKKNSIQPGWDSHGWGWLRMKRALYSLRNIALILPDGDAWMPVSVRRFPSNGRMDGKIVFDVLMPRGNERGSLIHRPDFRRLGVISARQYRAYLGLVWLWRKHLTAKGWMWGPWEQEVKRYENKPDGPILSITDSKVVFENGQPCYRASHSLVIPTGKRIRRKNADNFPALDARDRILLTHGRIESGNPNQRKRADASVEAMTETSRRKKKLPGLVVIEKHADDRWQTWPSQHYINLHNALNHARLKRLKWGK